MRIWSEVPRRRTQELVADAATAIWVVIWVSIGVQLYTTLAELSSVGVSVGDAGAALQNAGASLRLALSQIPLIGGGVADVVGGAFTGVGSPLVQAGSDLEQLLLIVAALLGLLVVAVALIPWLSRYLPWRSLRWQRLNAGDRAVNRGAAFVRGDLPHAELQRVLASRAIHRLEYADLLEYTPDPIGDFTAGRFDRLARAEMESVGLRKGAESGASLEDTVPTGG